MDLKRTTGAGLLAAALALGAAARAEAATGIVVTPYSVGFGQDSFAAFDPTLGTLLSVSIQISGQLDPLIVSDATAMAEPVFITQSFTGFAGKGFSTTFAATITGQILSTVPGEAAIPIVPYLNEITFDGLTDRAGFAADSYGSTYSGHLADFLAGGPSGDQILEMPTYIAWALGATGAALPAISTFLQGGGLVTYTYEIAPVGAPVPEPALWLALLAGFGLTGLRLRRRDPPLTLVILRSAES